jgi:hypothetical protein
MPRACAECSVGIDERCHGGGCLVVGTAALSYFICVAQQPSDFLLNYRQLRNGCVDYSEGMPKR